MDLFSIFGSIWRHKFLAAPVILFTFLGMFYFYEVKPSVYQAQASILLINPPGPPTAAQIAENPRLRNINPNNPYVDFGNLSVVADVVISLITSSSGQQALVHAGADSRYQAALSYAFGSPPIINITGVGSSAQESILSANLVAAAVKTDLHQLQVKQHVDSYYMITSNELVMPTQARVTVSGKLRTLIGVLGMGIILLLVVVSAGQAMEKRRKDRSTSTDVPVTPRNGTGMSATPRHRETATGQGAWFER